MPQPDTDKLYSDPNDQRTLADALSQTAGPYSTDNLVSALRKKDQSATSATLPASASPMQPWALDAPPVRTQAEQQRHVTAATPEVMQAMQRQRAEADQQAAQQRIAGAQRAPDAAPQQAAGSAAAPQTAPIPAAPAQTVPEHWVNTMDPASRAAMAAGQGEQLAGVGGEAGAESAAANEMASAAYHGHEDARVQQLLDQQLLDPERQKLDEHAKQLQAQAVKLSQAKVDPERYMAHQSTGAKVLMALGLAFSGFGAGLRGGPNTSMEMIKGAIDDDNRAQLQNIENAKGGLEAQKGILADKMKLFGNKEQALAAARQEQLQGVAAQIDDMARQYQSPTILAKAQQLKGELQQHFAAEGAAVEKYVPAQTVGGGPTQAQLEKEAYELVKGKDMNPADAMDAVRYLHGMQANAPTGFYERPGTGKADPTAIANQGLQNIEALRDTHGKLPTTALYLQQHGGGWLPATTKGRQLDGAITQLAEIQAKATGRASPALIQQIKHTIIGNGSAADVEAGIKRARSLIQAGSATPLAGTPAAGPAEAPPGFEETK
jgi:hypothetical protein